MGKFTSLFRKGMQRSFESDILLVSIGDIALLG